MVKMEVSAIAELEYSTSSVDSCESSRSSILSCHKTGASVESEIRTSLLDMLRSPRPSDLARKRKIHANPPPVGNKQSQAGTSTRKHEPKTVTSFITQECRECLALKRNVVANYWSSSARMVFLVQPSSAAAERVFSMLNRSFGDQQRNSLEDYVEATNMLQYNKR